MACLLSAGCDTRTPETTIASAPGIGAAPVATPVRIFATEAGFEMPDTIAAGLRHVVFENRTSHVKEALFTRLPEGMSGADFAAAVERGELFPEGALDYSGPGLTSPGQSAELWLPLDPGTYILFCWNRDHPHPQPLKSFIVEDRGDADDAPPPEDVVLKLVDFRFELSRPLRAGVQVVRVEPVGPSLHEVDFWRLADGRTVADVKAWYKKKGEPPGKALGGVLDSHALGRPVWFKRAFPPGRYALHCVMPMSTDAQASTGFATHADAGMVSEFEITH